MNFWNPSGFYQKYRRKIPKFTPNLAILNSLFQFKAFSSHRLQQRNGDKNLNKALRLTDLVSPKPTRVNNQESHLQLIQDFLENHLKHSIKERSSIGVQSDHKLSSFSFRNDDPLLGIFGLHREGLRIDVGVVSYALSVCGCRGNLHYGTQLQCLAVRDGLFVNVYIGSSLISMYSKCGDLGSAYKVFDEMPVRNVVSWTALISGYAQEFQVDVCLDLYTQMRNSSLKPNDFTLTSLLTSCVGHGSLGQGKTAHCQAILWGVDSYVHVANALISMYCKCGNVDDALFVFKAIHDKDIVSWNSMIAGYALHGLAHQAIGLYEEMIEHKIKPDGITFLGILSSCRHAGLVDQGRFFFNSMLERGLEPDLGHYSCIVDLLGRAGLIDDARDFIREMPIEANAIIWGSLLSSCRFHDNVWIGIEAAESRLTLEPSCAATHVQLAKLYARVGLWDKVAKVWKIMKDTELKTNPGCSWIEIGNEVFRFRADDTSNSKMNEILLLLEGIMNHLTVEEIDKDEVWIVS